MDARISVALFGLGRAGTIHFKNLLANTRVHLAYIVEADLKKANTYVEKYNLTNTQVVLPDNDDLVYKDGSVVAVVICSPTFTHEELVKKAVGHGKAVFCEKPIGEDMKATDICYQAAKAANKPLFCSFNRRYDPTVRAIHDRVKQGDVGNIHVIKTCSRDSPLPPIEYLKISGGMFHDCAVHDIDLICWILGEYPVKVYTQACARMKAIQDMNDVDTVAIVMNFPSGIIATIDLSRHASYGYDQRIEVFGDGGMLEAAAQRPTSVVSYSSQGTGQDRMLHSFPQRYAESYVNAMDHFLDVVQGKAEIEISREATLKCSIVASACEESWKTNNPVELNYSQFEDQVNGVL